MYAAVFVVSMPWTMCARASRNNVVYLNVSKCNLTELDERMADLQQLNALILDDNPLRELPDAIGRYARTVRQRTGRSLACLFSVCKCARGLLLITV